MKALDAIAIGTCYVDINLSGYPFGETGIPAETELVGGAYETEPGGSAVNFCRLLGACGLTSAFIGMAGRDPHGALLETLLQDSGVEPLLVRQPELLTNISFNMTSPEGQHIMLVAGTANQALRPEAVLPRLTTHLDQMGILYIGGCFKLQSLAPAYQQIATLARQHNTDIVVDHGRIPAATPPEMFEAVRQLVLQATYYLPSRAEFCQLWDVANVEEGLQLLKAKAPNLQVVVKDGANGAHYWDTGSIRRIQPPKVDTVVQVTSAGDSFNAGFIAAMSKQQRITNAIRHGCAVAAAKISGQPLPQLLY